MAGGGAPYGLRQAILSEEQGQALKDFLAPRVIVVPPDEKDAEQAERENWDLVCGIEGWPFSFAEGPDEAETRQDAVIGMRFYVDSCVQDKECALARCSDAP